MSIIVVPSAVYSEAYTDNRVKKHGRERQHYHHHIPPYYHPMYPPHPHYMMHPHVKKGGKIPYYGPPPPGYMMPPPPRGPHGSNPNNYVGYPPPPPHMMYPPFDHRSGGMPPHPFPPGYYPFFPPFPEEGGVKNEPNPSGKRRQEKKRQKSKDKVTPNSYDNQLTVDSEEDLFEQNEDAPKGLNKFLY